VSEPLLKIRNHHAPACGDPPIVTDDTYVGYFENGFGEQWIYTFNRHTNRAELRGGDIGWNQVHEVIEGSVPTLMMSPDERLWLSACWKATHPQQAR
jgi:hypothetical protein